MRVQFLQHHKEAGFEEHPQGAVVQMDRGVAEALIERGIVIHAPLADEEIIALANEIRPGDENLSGRDIAFRNTQLLQIYREIN